ncbi:hypothetical protein F4780DRAFT_427202 [Xylariomycetidae sp. FL0641]|nr:hypothetical protein F4780DRAFT_427202 [Xylariomycetidae sp. FL0641]
MRVFPIVNKARKPKFELHLSIYDLNNVPLVAGVSFVKWHLPNSIHAEHRGRTPKCSVDKVHHRIVYNYSKIVPLRITIDRMNNLTECPLEFEVLQEFPMVPGGGRDEKVSLGTIRLNLSEYVEESESVPRRSTTFSRNGASMDQPRRRVSTSRPASDGLRPVSPTNSSVPLPHMEENDVVDEEAEEGIVRRYLMQDSKINSTLKIGILMVQVDGERSYVAPPLKSAPMFGGIAGIMKGEAPESEEVGPGAIPNLNKSRDASELQDMYRRALAASWACQPGELPADECIEDIFSGGSGWRDGTTPARKKSTHRSGRRSRTSASRASASRRSSLCSSQSSHTSASSDEAATGTLRPSGVRRMQTHLRMHSGASDRSAATVTNDGTGNGDGLLTPGLRNNAKSSGNEPDQHHHHSFRHGLQKLHHLPHHRSRASISNNLSGSGSSGKEEDGSGTGLSSLLSQETSKHSRSGSLTSMASTLGSTGSDREEGGRGREGFRPPREVDEYEVRDDLVAWKLPETVA